MDHTFFWYDSTVSFFESFWYIRDSGSNIFKLSLIEIKTDKWH